MQTLLEIIEKQNQADTTQYLKTIKIQSAQQRTDFEQLVQNAFQQRNDKFETLLSLLLASKDLPMRNLLSEIFTKQFLQFNDFNKKEQAVNNWHEIPIEYLEEYFQKFQINLNNVQDVRQKIFTMLQNKKAQQALKLMQIFQNQLDMSIFMDKFIQLDAIAEFSKVCEQSPKLLNEFINKLSESDRRNQQKLATELIKKHNLNKEDYPILIKIQNRQAIDRIYFPKIEESYERVEERLQGYPFMLKHVIEKLLENNKVDEAYSVAVRNGLNDIYHLKGKLLENPLLNYDGFGITEYICFKENPKDYVLFEDFNISENNVHFIDSVEKIQQVESQILQSPLTGFDTEFCHYFDEFASGGVAILQLATETDIYIFDIYNLKQEQVLINFLNNYFSNNEIKIGHSVRNDFNEMARNMSLNQLIQPVNLVDLSVLFNEVYENNKSNVSLANQVYQIFGKKLSKKECFSNWQRRPLRKCQLYYSAMDAYICIAIFKKLQQSQQNFLIPQDLQQKQTQQKTELLIQKTQNFRYHVQYKHFFQNKKKMLFLIDSMLKKLAGFLRNLGFDAEYNEKNDHKGLESQAIQEGRIIITRDKKLFDKQSLNAPCFLLSDNLNTEQQFEELHSVLQFKILSSNILNRCVKCNYDHVVCITAEKAKQFLDFKNGDSFQKIQEFWQCEKCLQVYWEGNQFKNSMERFSKVVKKEKQKQ